MAHQTASDTDGRQTPNQAAAVSFTIRPAHADEAPVLAAIEAAGFPPAEAASLERISERLRVFPEQFFVAEADGRAYTDTMRERGKAGVILTCKEHLVDWYGRFGFRNHGTADSEHGGATWYDMKYIWAP